MTGKAGANAFGALVERDEITNIILAGSDGSRSTSLERKSTAMAARYERDVGENSTKNTFFNGREADDYYYRVAGSDLRSGIRTSKAVWGIPGIASRGVGGPGKISGEITSIRSMPMAPCDAAAAVSGLTMADPNRHSEI